MLLGKLTHPFNDVGRRRNLLDGFLRIQPPTRIMVTERYAFGHGYQIVEVPIPWYFNPDSKIRMLHDSWRMVLDLLAIRRNGRAGLYR